MAEENENISETEFEEERLSLWEEMDPVALVENVYQLWWNWADFHIFIVSPTIESVSPPNLIKPEQVEETDELEYVYPIYDYGYKLSTSKAEDMLSAGMSMCKLHYTIEKMVAILVDRLTSSGASTSTEVQVAFGGHELAQRKAFESIINLSYNVVVTNFDPGAWGQHYLEVVKRLADKGYGYPTEAPRDTYRHTHSSAPSAKK